MECLRSAGTDAFMHARFGAKSVCLGLFALAFAVGCGDDETSTVTISGPETYVDQLLSNPSPALGAAGVGPEVAFSWTVSDPEVFTDYNLYVGTNADAVAGAATGSTDDPTFVAGLTEPSYTMFPAIDPDTTYFWRVDLSNDSVTLKGPVWSFVSYQAPVPGVAGTPTPNSGASDVALDVTFSWEVGAGGGTAESYHVYLGTELAAVQKDSQSGTYQGEQSAQTYKPATALERDLTYYWRVDTVNSFGVTKGPVWDFSSILTEVEPDPELPGAVTGAMPVPGSANVAIDTALAWEAASLATGYEVFWGTTLAEVVSAESGGAASLGTTDTTAWMLEAVLDYDQAYFWRVDAINDDGTTAGPVWSFVTEGAPVPGAFEYLEPASGSVEVSPSATLSWNASENAEAYQVYMGTDLLEVTVADTGSSVYIGEQSETSYTPDAPLDLEQVYYWRVDAVNGDGVFSGVVWSFGTIVPEAAQLPGMVTGAMPVPGALDVPVDTPLGWMPADFATSYDVFLSTDLDQLNASSLGTSDTAGWTLAEPLEYGQSYFWRVNAINEDGTTVGPVWSFTTSDTPIPGAFAYLTPAAGDISVDPEVGAVLSWEESERAETYHVYLSASLSEVLLADTGSAAYVGEQAETTYVADGVDFASVYYWRVDAVNDFGSVMGPAWSFGTLSLELPEGLSDPLPVDEELLTNANNVTLSWSGGEGGLTFDVYLGTDLEEVQNAGPDSETYQGNHDGPDVQPEGPFEFGQTYYWRVDVTNEAGTIIGQIWTFTTETESLEPDFGGVRSVVLTGTSAIRVEWVPGLDERDAQATLNYHVFASNTSGVYDFETPLATVPGDQSAIVLTGSEVETLLEGDALYVVVRAEDSDEISEQNTVEIGVPVPHDLGIIYVEEGSVEGDGSVTSPFGSLLEGFTAAGENGGIVLVAEGTYTEAVLMNTAGPNPILIYGGFPSWSEFADTEELTLLEARHSKNHPVVWLEPDTDVIRFVDLGGNYGGYGGYGNYGDAEELDVLYYPALVLDHGPRWTVLDGIEWHDPSSQGIVALGVTLTLANNIFIGAEELTRNGFGDDGTVGTIVHDGEHRGVLEASAGEGEAQMLNVVGNTFRDQLFGILIDGPTPWLNVSGNALFDVNRYMVGQFSFDEGEGEGEGITIISTYALPPGEATLHVEKNKSVRLWEGMVQATFAGVPEDGADFEIRVLRNNASFVGRAYFDLSEMGRLGAGGRLDMHAAENRVLGSDGDVFDLSLAYSVEVFDPQTEQIWTGYQSDVPMAFRFIDNEMLHGDSDAISFENLMPATDAELTLEVAHNTLSHTESEGVRLRSPEYDWQAGLAGENGQVEVNMHNNRAFGLDGMFNASIDYIPNGRLDIRIEDNVSTGDNDTSVDVDIRHPNGVPSEEETLRGELPEGTRGIGEFPDTNTTLTVVGNTFLTEDDGVELSVAWFGGTTDFLIENNTIVVDTMGIDFQSSRTFMPLPDETSSRLTVRNNDVTSANDGFSGAFRINGGQGELNVTHNRLVSLQDVGLDLDLGSASRVVIADNVIESLDAANTTVDYVGATEDEGGEFARIVEPTHMDLLIYNNDMRRGQRDNLEINMSEEVQDFLTTWVAQNDLYSNAESDGFRVNADFQPLLALFERNVFGFNDVDSSDGLSLNCRGDGGHITVRNNLASHAAGAGIFASCRPQLFHNTLIYNNASNSESAGLEGELNFDYYQGDRGERGRSSIPLNETFYAQTFSVGMLVARNTRSDLDLLHQHHLHYSLVGESEQPWIGYGSIVGDPVLQFCEDPLDFVACATLHPTSPAIDAGHPDWSDPDGTRADVGVFGGPFAGALGFQGVPETESGLPLVFIGMRPMSELFAGGQLMPLDAELELIFTLELDDASVDGAISVLNSEGSEVSGTWRVTGNRAWFEPDGFYAPETHYSVEISDALAAKDGTALWRADSRDFTTEPGKSLLTEVEPNDLNEDALALPQPVVFSAVGELNPWEGDSRDVYSIQGVEGQRLMSRVWMNLDPPDIEVDGVNNDGGGGNGIRNQFIPFDMRLTLMAEDGTVLNDSIDEFWTTIDFLVLEGGLGGGDDLPTNIIPLDPYIDFVFPEDGLYYLVVRYEEPLENLGLPPGPVEFMTRSYLLGGVKRDF